MNNSVQQKAPTVRLTTLVRLVVRRAPFGWSGARDATGLLMGCAAALLLPGVAFAGTGWELSGSTYPTNLIAGVDGVQEVTPEGTSFSLSFEGQSTGSIEAGKGPGVVQSALEGLSTVGAGNVRVEGAEAGPFRVTFIGALGDVDQTHPNRFGEPEPDLGAARASVGIVVEGASSGTIGVDVLNVGSTASSGQITFTDRLPAGLRAKRAGELLDLARSSEEGFGVQARLGDGWDCSGNGGGAGQGVVGATVVTCVNAPELPYIEGGGGYPTYTGNGVTVGYPQPPVGIEVEALQPAITATGTNVASITDWIFAMRSGSVASGIASLITPFGRPVVPEV